MSYLKFVPKRWGGERHLVNSKEHNYCGKILTIISGYSLSYHYHPIKAESFFVQEGLGHLIFSNDNKEIFSGSPDSIGGLRKRIKNNGGWLESRKISKGDIIHIPPNHPHKIWSTHDLTIIEFSTFDCPTDSIRLENIGEDK